MKLKNSLEVIMDAIYKIKEDGYVVKKLRMPKPLRQVVIADILTSKTPELYSEEEREILKSGRLKELMGIKVVNGDNFEIVIGLS